MKTTTWAWIFGLGGAFTMVAGWLSARAKAVEPSSGTGIPAGTGLPPGVVVPAGVTLTAADVVFINTAYASKVQAGDVTAACPFATCPDGGVNGYLGYYLMYKTSPSGFAQAMNVHPVPAAGMSFQQFVAAYH